MADLTSVGAIKILARVGVGVADSSDAGNTPEYLPAAGTVRFTPTLKGPTTVIPDNLILPVATITCELDQFGYLRPPLDGVSAGMDAEGNLYLISPQSEALLDRGWFWEAAFVPSVGQRWTQFTIRNITGAPGEEVALTTAFPTSSETGTKQLLVFEVDTFDEPFPAGFRAGVDYLLRTSDMTLARVEA